MIARAGLSRAADLGLAPEADLSAFAALFDRDPGGPKAAPDLPLAVPPEGPACVVGIIDHGIPVAHPDLAADGHSRIAAAWMMGADGPSGRLPLGRRVTGREIDAALARAGTPEGAHRALGGVSVGSGRGRRTALLRAATHGAAVADLAAGRGGADLPVVAVDLPDAVVRDTGGTALPFYLLLGTLFVLDEAARLSAALGRRLPVVVNASLGVTAGAKDGTGLLPRFQDAVAAATDLPVGPVRFVAPMGNHRAAAVAGRLGPDQAVGWRIPPDDGTPSFLEIHAPEGAMGTLSLARPGGAPVPLDGLPPGRARDLEADGVHLARAHRTRRAGVDGPVDVVTLAVPPTDGSTGRAARGLPGTWRIARLGGTGPADVYVQRDDRLLGGGARPSRLVDVDGPVIDEGRSVNPYATGTAARRAGAWLGRGPAAYSGRDDARGAAEGDVRVGVDSGRTLAGRLASGVAPGSAARLSGTSAAAALVARAEAEALRDGAELLADGAPDAPSPGFEPPPGPRARPRARGPVA